MTLTQSFLQFMLLCTIASIGGVSSYFLLPMLQAKQSTWTACVVIASITFIVWFYMFFPLLIVALPFCLIGAFAEKALTNSDDSWKIHFFSMSKHCIFAITLNIWLAFFAFVVLKVMPNQRWDELLPLLIGFVVGTVVTPLALLLFTWMYNASKLRPGIDRHQNDGDEPI